MPTGSSPTARALLALEILRSYGRWYQLSHSQHPRPAMIYQHATGERDRTIAEKRST